MPITQSTPTLADFRAALHRADQLKHTDIHVSRQGTIRSSRPNWGVRVVRFVKKFFTNKPSPSFRAQTHNIDVFRKAILSKNNPEVVRFANRRLSEFVTQHRPIDKTYYAHVIQDIDQRRDAFKTNLRHIHTHVAHLVRNHELDKAQAQTIIDKSVHTIRQTYYDNTRTTPLNPEEVRDVVSNLVAADDSSLIPKAGSFSA